MTYKYIDNPTDPQPERDLESGASFPFDASDEWMEREDSELPPPPPVDWAHAAARGIISNLRGRRGIKQELQIYNIDEDVRVEIITAIAAIIRKSSEDKLAALQAQLAAREWRPVTEPPEIPLDDGPDENEWFLIGSRHSLGFAHWDGDTWTDIKGYEIRWHSHWMPTPIRPAAR